MSQENPRRFQFSTRVTPALLSEYQWAYQFHNPIFIASNIITLLFLVLYTAHCVFFGSLKFYSRLILFVSAVNLIQLLIAAYQKKHGSKLYRKMAAENKLSQRYSFDTEGIHNQNVRTENSAHFRYDEIRSVFQSKKLLVFILPKRRCLLVERWTIMGGTEEEFLTFLLSHCPKLRRKKVATVTFGKAVWCTRTVCLLLCVLLAVFSGIGDLIAPVGTISNSLPYHEIARELEAVGITGADPELLETLQRSYEEYEDTYGGEYSKVMDLLCWLGYEEYDPETWEWTPANSGVYWFDFEVVFVECMYSDFLRGVSALAPEELDFSNIQDDNAQVDWENMTGTQAVTFSWNGEQHRLAGSFTGDWFDPRVGDSLNSILQSSGNGKQLYFAFDGGQGCLVFYGDAQWGKAFERLTGVQLFENMTDAFNGPVWFF